MILNTIVRRCLGISISAAAVIIFMAGISIAEETGVPVSDKPVGEVTTEPIPPLPAVAETGKTTATGAYYRIDANSFAYYEKPKLYSFLVNAPLDIVDWLKDSFPGEKCPYHRRTGSCYRWSDRR